MKRLPRSAFIAVMLVSALLFVVTCLLWLAAPLGGAGFFVVQGPTTTYVVAATDSLLVRVGDVSPDPQRPATYRWQRFGGRVDSMPRDCFGMEVPSVWSRVGILRTMEHFPYSDGIAFGVLRDKLFRFEYVRDNYPANKTGASYFCFVDVAAGKPTPAFAKGRQQGQEFLAEAVYDGTLSSFLRGYFP